MDTTLMRPAAQVAPEIDYQAIAMRNIKMMLMLRGMKQVDLAAYMGKNKQNLNRMLRTGSSWTFNDVVKAAKFFNVSVDELMCDNLSQADLIGNDNEGGLQVAVNSGYRRRGDYALTA